MERTLSFVLKGLVVLEVFTFLPSLWLCLLKESTWGLAILRILVCPLRLLQFGCLLQHCWGTWSAQNDARCWCCWKMLPYCLVVLESLFLFLQSESMGGTTFRTLLMIAHVILLIADVFGMTYLISPLSDMRIAPDRENAHTECCKWAAPLVLTSEEAAGSCNICLEDFAEGNEVQRLPCGHMFHNHCIQEWFLRSRSCPLRCEPGTLPRKVPLSDMSASFSSVLPGQVVVEPVDPHVEPAEP